MCGRIAQTVQAVRMAASMLQVDLTPNAQRQLDESRDNYNLSPGMDAYVFYLDDDKNKNGNNSQVLVRMDRKVWGLVSRNGTATSPIESGMGKHFQNLMFNARADTLYEKSTFSRLLQSQRACLIAVDGFFEWKTVTGGLKQPYFVSSQTLMAKNDDSSFDDAAVVTAPFMLLAGLWTSVETGQTAEDGTAERLDTFTIITTDACESLRWLHSRMPLTVTNGAWLYHCNRLPNESPPLFRWHAVTTAMASMKFRSEEAIRPLPKMKTVKSMFAEAAMSAQERSSSKKVPTAATASVSASGKKRTSTQHKAVPSPQRKKEKKNVGDDKTTPPIDSFFKPKAST